MFFETHVTINLPGNMEVEKYIAAKTLDMIWDVILNDYPAVTSVVLTFTTPKSE